VKAHSTKLLNDTVPVPSEGVANWLQIHLSQGRLGGKDSMGFSARRVPPILKDFIMSSHEKGYSYWDIPYFWQKPKHMMYIQYCTLWL
jgi:hypothetical protein